MKELWHNPHKLSMKSYGVSRYLVLFQFTASEPKVSLLDTHTSNEQKMEKLFFRELYDQNYLIMWINRHDETNCQLQILQCQDQCHYVTVYDVKIVLNSEC